MVAARARGRPTANDPSTISTEALLDAALDSFAARGYEGTSVRELARELGVSHNLIPQRIGNKEQLWFAAVDRGFGALAVALAGVLNEDETSDDLERLRAVVIGFVEANATRPALLRIINREATTPGPRLDYLFNAYISPARDFGAELLARLRAAGRVRSDSVTLLYFLMTHGAAGPLGFPELAARFGDVADPNDPAAVHRHAVEATNVIFDGLIGHS